ncbi:hypothetical protein D3C83_165140 [compost metagenome]
MPSAITSQGKPYCVMLLVYVTIDFAQTTFPFAFSLVSTCSRLELENLPLPQSRSARATM